MQAQPHCSWQRAQARANISSHTRGVFYINMLPALVALGCICVHQAVPAAAVTQTLTTDGAAAAMAMNRGRSSRSSGAGGAAAAATLRANVSSLCGRDGTPNTSVTVTYSGVARPEKNPRPGLCGAHS